MQPSLSPRLIMLGAAPETRGSIAAVVEAYRAHGLFARWPIEHLAAALRRRRAAQRGARRRGAARLRLARRAAPARSVLHVHSEAGAGFWRDAAFMAAAAALRCPVVLQLHGSGFERFYDRGGAPGARADPARARARRLRGGARRVDARLDPRRVPRGARGRACRRRWRCRRPARRCSERPPLVLFLGKLEARDAACSS